MNIDLTQIIVAIIVAIPPTLVAILALIQGMKNGRATEEIHLSVNSRMDELLAVTKGESHAEGLAQGRKETK